MIKEINKIVAGKKISNVIASHSHHKFEWINRDPQDYNNLLAGKVVIKAEAVAGYVEITVEDVVLLFGDGINFRFHGIEEKRPQKHQLLVDFDDFTAISATVQMYGGLWCFNIGEFDNSYYLHAKEVYLLRKTNDFQPYLCCELNEEKRKEFIDNKDKLFLLLDNDKLIASILVNNNGLLDDLFVLPSYQGKGYGKKIMQFAINQAIKNGSNCISLAAIDWNTKALNLYQSLGFNIAQTTHYYRLF